MPRPSRKKRYRLSHRPPEGDSAQPKNARHPNTSLPRPPQSANPKAQSPAPLPVQLQSPQNPPRPTPNAETEPSPARPTAYAPRPPQPRGPISKGRYDAPGDPALSIDTQLTLEQLFTFDGALAKRIHRRQINAKEAFTIRDTTGTYFRVSLKDLTPDGGAALPYERMDRTPEPNLDITLACSVLGRQRMIFVMQKATELGVTSILPLLTDYSVPSSNLDYERANSWPGQVIRAVKQCRRSSVPHVLPPVYLDDFLASPDFSSADTAIVLDDRSEPAPPLVARPQKVILFIGPEGGFSDAERATLAPKTRAWILGGRILRAETAVLAGLTAVQMTYGDFAV